MTKILATTLVLSSMTYARPTQQKNTIQKHLELPLSSVHLATVPHFTLPNNQMMMTGNSTLKQKENSSVSIRENQKP